MTRNIRSPSITKKGPDGKPFTPTEEARKRQLMRQFLKVDGPKGNSPEFKANYDSIDWSA